MAQAVTNGHDDHSHAAGGAGWHLHGRLTYRAWPSGDFRRAEQDASAERRDLTTCLAEMRATLMRFGQILGADDARATPER